MNYSKWQRRIGAALIAAMVVTTVFAPVFAPAALAQDAAATATPAPVQEVSAMLPGGQFAKIWLGLTPIAPGKVVVTAEWDRPNPEDNGVGFYVLDEQDLTAVVNGGDVRDNNLGRGDVQYFLNGANNVQGAAFNATGTSYTVVLYNDSNGDANVCLKADNGSLSSDVGEVKIGCGAAAMAPESTATEEAAATATATAAAPAAVAEATVVATPAVTATAAVAAPATATVTAGPLRAQEVDGALPEQYDQHLLGLEPSVRDGEIKLSLTFDPQDSQELARRLNFWVLDDQSFRRYLAGENAADLAVAAGNRIGDNNIRTASFRASGFGTYTVIVYNNSRVPAEYNLRADGGILIDDSAQTLTAQQGATAVSATDATTSTTTVATTTTTTTTEAAATTPGVTGEPGGTYTVKSGDTLAIIARDIYGDYRLYEQLCAFNGIADCNVIEIDQVIKLPTNEQIQAGVTAAPAAAATPAAVATVAATPAATAVAATASVTTTETTTTTTTTAPAATTIVTSTGTTTSTTGSAAPATTTKSIVDVATGAGNFSILVDALKATGLDSALAEGGPYTVFAPTDAAFNQLLSASNISAGDLLKARELADILKFHVVSGDIMSSDITDKMKATTLQGRQVTFEVKDGKVFVNGAQVSTTDIPAGNGVIHAIDAVILPPAQ